MEDEILEATDPTHRPPAAPRWVWLALGAVVAAGVAAAIVFRPRPGPPPKEIAGDPLLVAGREVFLSRCVSCHGESGRGDGPIAKSISGPPPGDLTDDRWQHGDAPGEVLAVIREGVRGTSMAGWKGSFGEDDLKAVAAYVYHLAGREPPDALRRP